MGLLKIKDNAANIKLQSIPEFFAYARPDAHEKMRVRLQSFFIIVQIVSKFAHHD